MLTRVAIILPPVWSTETPYLGTAMLAATCTGLGVPHEAFDCNLAYWRWLTTGERKLRILRKVERLPPGDPMRLVLEAHSTDPREALDLALADPRRRRDLASLAIAENHALQPPSDTASYHDRFFNSVSLSEHALHADDLWRVAHDETENPFAVALADTIRDVLDYRPDLVLITITSVSQAVAAYTIARVLREQSQARVVAGGAWVTQLWSSIAKSTALMDLIPYLARYEGEPALPVLCAFASGTASANDVPNLVWKDEAGRVVVNKTVTVSQLDRLPTPEFDGFDLRQYDYRETLSLQASRGCYYGACAFCSYPVVEPSYRVMKAERVMEHVACLAQRYRASALVFTDAVLAPGFLRRLVGVAANEALPCRFAGYARFHKNMDARLMSELARVGCSGLVWGLETADPELQRTLDKDLPSLPEISAILENARQAGLENRLAVMYGIPGETFEQAIKTVDFVRAQAPRLHSITYSRFTLERATPLALAAGTADEIPLGDLSLRMPMSSSLSAAGERALLAEYRRLDAWLATSNFDKHS